jgi:putative Mg2+ transporter-C (MgtC) family protein
MANEWHFILQLFLAAVLGGLVGLERQFHGRPAGLRTHILVCLGSAVIIIAFQRLQAGLSRDVGAIVTMDPARAAAGIITGIGFLGAGTILKGKDFIRGLTTAASIWVVAAIGITTGLGQYHLAIVTAGLVLFALFVLDKIDLRSGHYGEIHLEGKGGLAFCNETQRRLSDLGFTVKGYRVEALTEEDSISLSYTVRFREREMDFGVIEALSRVDGVRAVSWER